MHPKFGDLDLVPDYVTRDWRAVFERVLEEESQAEHREQEAVGTEDAYVYEMVREAAGSTRDAVLDGFVAWMRHELGARANLYSNRETRGLWAAQAVSRLEPEFRALQASRPEMQESYSALVKEALRASAKDLLGLAGRERGKDLIDHNGHTL